MLALTRTEHSEGNMSTQTKTILAEIGQILLLIFLWMAFVFFIATFIYAAVKLPESTEPMSDSLALFIFIGIAWGCRALISVVSNWMIVKDTEPE